MKKKREKPSGRGKEDKERGKIMKKKMNKRKGKKKVWFKTK